MLPTIRPHPSTASVYGGAMPSAKGVPEDQIAMAVQKYGVCKVNIDTDLRLALTAKGVIDHSKTWDIAENELPLLRRQVQALLTGGWEG